MRGHSGKFKVCCLSNGCAISRTGKGKCSLTLADPTPLTTLQMLSAGKPRFHSSYKPLPITASTNISLMKISHHWVRFPIDGISNEKYAEYTDQEVLRGRF